MTCKIKAKRDVIMREFEEISIAGGRHKLDRILRELLRAIQDVGVLDNRIHEWRPSSEEDGRDSLKRLSHAFPAKSQIV